MDTVMDEKKDFRMDGWMDEWLMGGVGDRDKMFYEEYAILYIEMKVKSSYKYLDINSGAFQSFVMCICI